MLNFIGILELNFCTNALFVTEYVQRQAYLEFSKSEEKP
jgi:hypothetical protein